MRPKALWAIVPVKRLAEAKSRLAPALPPDARRALGQALLCHVLNVLAAAPEVTQTIVVSRDDAALAMARARGLVALAETGEELNTALTEASRYANMHGADAVLIIPADLPLLAPDDVAALAALATAEPCVVLAPARADDGTNALLVRPPGLLAYRFGPASFAAHRQQTEANGWPLHIVRRSGLALDLDTPDDWARLQSSHRAWLVAMLDDCCPRPAPT